MDITFENFKWQMYININSDLKNTINNKKDAWNHWINYGQTEERPLTKLNNTYVHHARLGNLFFINMAVHFISLKYNLKCEYKYFDKFKKLGIIFHVGKNTYENSIELTDDNFLHVIQNDETLQNIIINNDSWFQTEMFIIFLKSFFSISYNKFKIINNNIFKSRYKNNNDLFIHVRIGDVETKINKIVNYYEKAIEKVNYITGYISSDSIDNNLCKYLISKYNLIPIDKDEIETIMFASTCNNIILSGGTYSWLIGFLAFDSNNIFYPNIKNPWYGNIFDHFDWNSINFN